MLPFQSQAMKVHSHFWQKIPFLAVILFQLGFLGGIALRLTLFVEPYGVELVKVVWYTGTIAYAFFYFFRILIEQHRREIFKDHRFFERLEKNELSQQDVVFLSDILQSIRRSKVLYNYTAWFILTMVSLVGAIVLI